MKAKRKKNAVICDLDDTIVDFLGLLVHFYNLKNNTCIHISDLKDYAFETLSVEDQYGRLINGKEFFKFFQVYEKHGLYAALPAITHSVHALELIRILGYTIIILTARPSEYELTTELNLTVNRIPYDKIIFSKDKAEQIKGLSRHYNIRCFVDDNLENVKAVLDTELVDNVYLIEKPHNRNKVVPEGITIVSDFIAVVRDLDDLR